MSDVPTARQARTPAFRVGGMAALLALIALSLAWLPFLTRLDLAVRHFDAPNYLVVAKTLYRPTAFNPLPGYALHPAFFTMQLPMFPLVIRVFAPLGGYESGLFLAMLLCVATSAAAFAIYLRSADPEIPLVAGVLAFLFLPARMFLYRALGSTEALMALLIFGALLAFRREKIFLAFALAGLASITRINGLLLTGVFGLSLLGRRKMKTAFLGGVIALLPLVATFAWHGHLFGDPLSFLRVHHDISADKQGKLTPIPFGFIGVLAASNDWETAEMLLALFLFYVLAAGRLFVLGHRVEAGLVAAHVVLFAFMRERDLARYFLTVAPFAVVLAWREVWQRPRVAAVVLGLLGTLAVAYAWQTIPMNLCSPEAYRALRAFLNG